MLEREFKFYKAHQKELELGVSGFGYFIFAFLGQRGEFKKQIIKA